MWQGPHSCAEVWGTREALRGKCKLVCSGPLGTTWAQRPGRDGTSGNRQVTGAEAFASSSEPGMSIDNTCTCQLEHLPNAIYLLEL